MEATVRIELTHKGFADPSLTTWVRRPGLRSTLRSTKYFVLEMERETGFEPATTCLGSRCSTAELLPHDDFSEQP